MRSIYRDLACATLLAIAAPSPGMTQQPSLVSLDVNVGATAGRSSSAHMLNGGGAIDALLGFRRGVSARATHGSIVAFSWSGEAIGAHSACELDVTPGGSCTPDFPGFAVFSVLAGWETAKGGARLLVGPALAIPGDRIVGAAQGRVHLAQPILDHFALLVSSRVAWIPRYRADSFILGSLGVGFRIQ